MCIYISIHSLSSLERSLSERLDFFLRLLGLRDRDLCLRDRDLERCLCLMKKAKDRLRRISLEKILKRNRVSTTVSRSSSYLSLCRYCDRDLSRSLSSSRATESLSRSRSLIIESFSLSRSRSLSFSLSLSLPIESKSLSRSLSRSLSLSRSRISR